MTVWKTLTWVALPLPMITINLAKKIDEKMDQDKEYIVKKRIFKSKKIANENSINSADMDHIIPLKNLQEKFANNSHIHKNNIQELEESKENSNYINASISRIKNKETWTEYIKKYPNKLNAEEQKQALELEKIQNIMQSSQMQLSKNGNYFDGIKAMVCVGVACAISDGEISDIEKSGIEDFILGVCGGHLPNDLRDNIDKIYLNPPNITTAFVMANSLGLDSLELFDEIINVTIQADDEINESESIFLTKWNDLKKM